MLFPCLHRFVRGALLAGLTAAATQVVCAAPNSVEDFFKNPQYLGVKLSPNGQFLAASAPGDGRMNLVVIDLKARQGKRLTKFKDADVVYFDWVNDNRLVFSLGSLHEPVGARKRYGGGLFAVDRDGKDSRVLVPTVQAAIDAGAYVYRMSAFLARTRETSDDIIALANDRNAKNPDVYRLNTKTGRKTLLTLENPGEVQQWIVDKDGVPRAAIATDEKLKITTWWRSGADAKWVQLGQYDLFEKNLLPLAFGYDGTLYVTSNLGRDKYAIYTFDPERKALKDLVFEHPDIDLGGLGTGEADDGGLIFDPKTRKLAGVRYDADKPGMKWFDASWSALGTQLDQALPGRFNAFRPPQEGSSQVLVFSYSDRHSGTWFVFDLAAKKIEEAVSMRSWFKEDDLVAMQPLRFKARDGLEIPAYLFLPKGSAGKKLPLLVNIHGGPHARADYWGLQPWGALESQFLAQNGYAVLLPNFRMTPGFGHQLFTGGLRQIGKAMQEDIEDGIDELVRRGLVDPHRVCLYGASYGGYATLWGLVKTPEKYRCGIAALAVTDLELQLTSTRGDTVYSDEGSYFWAKMVGDPSKEAEALRAVSPAFHADRIKAPVMLIFGEADIRVPLEQGEKMKKALERAGKKPEWIVKEEEGHGFVKTENRVDMYTRMLKFLDQHLAPAASN
ncbi:acylaminoacyl-peptidase [Burkholderiales bacterium]|nr:MAG: S9 family peptidase [Burkholderiales bacterium]CAG0954363.1 acylaminoacyl-peptidase [Burkholderiales bacterium]